MIKLAFIVLRNSPHTPTTAHPASAHAHHGPDGATVAARDDTVTVAFAATRA